MAKGSRWTGDLNKPFRPRTVVRPHGFAVPNRDDPAAEQKVAEENDMMRRLLDEAVYEEEARLLALLAAHYRVQSGDFRALTLALAREFVPGFRYDTREIKGRPKLWKSERLWALLEDVEAVKRKEKLKKDREALMRLARTKKWSPAASYRGSSKSWLETLETRHQEGKRIDRRVRESLKLLHSLAREHSGKG